ncbi:M50 family metallopeptidase [Actinoallomurus rhizosphaericola]|uniref:M50 family metallopeptidase n=1 Tax=Actinoallomurus rhizosphaericola TaxID=2952536 RepID=UPI0020906E7B|nr:M50 family metallopeptidase [Actinoallomurus rhizosphaericola]MCO5992189.1 RIP metalloprotease [Actinoallomurus rhizosphaericola]
MTYLLGALAFVLALLLSVVLHEAGHFLTAKRFGMKATQFFVGFGSTLWSRRRGETEYGIKAIPLGGFVKIVGYTPLEEIDPADEARAFHRRPAIQRAIVIVAGVVVNLLLAFALMVVLAAVVGVPDGANATTAVRRVSPCVPVSGSACTDRDPVSPASAAGLRPRDRVLSFAGTPVRDWNGLSGLIQRTAPGTSVPVVVERHGARRTVTARIGRLDGHGYLGIEPVARVRTLGPVASVRFAGRFTGQMTAAIGGIVVDIPKAIPKLFSHERASTPGGQAGSVVGGAEASGQVFASGETWRTKLGMFLLLVSSLNLFVGLMNLVPLLPLDGGHLAVVCYERIKAWVFRVRGRPDPGPVDLTKLMPVTYAFVVLLVGLGVLLILADLINPLKLPQ